MASVASCTRSEVKVPFLRKACHGGCGKMMVDRRTSADQPLICRPCVDRVKDAERKAKKAEYDAKHAAWVERQAAWKERQAAKATGACCGPASLICHFCGETGHLKKQCPLLVKALDKQCLNCGEMGHTKGNCPLLVGDASTECCSDAGTEMSAPSIAVESVAASTAASSPLAERPVSMKELNEEEFKEITKLDKKLRDIEKLEKSKLSGARLENNQLDKLAAKEKTQTARDHAWRIAEARVRSERATAQATRKAMANALPLLQAEADLAPAKGKSRSRFFDLSR